jgi:hypothetical protein
MFINGNQFFNDIFCISILSFYGSIGTTVIIGLMVTKVGNIIL